MHSLATRVIDGEQRSREKEERGKREKENIRELTRLRTSPRKGNGKRTDRKRKGPRKGFDAAAICVSARLLSPRHVAAS